MTIITGGAGDDNLKGGNGADTISGGGGDDFLQGKAGNDIIDGGSGDDQIHGDGGDDYIIGGQGDDFIHGGTGTDTAVYSGSVLDYSFSSNGENFFVSHTGGTQLDGNDRLLHVEKLKFNDILIDLTQNNAPLAFDDTAATNEDNSVSGNVLTNDFDWEHDPLTATPGTFFGIYGTLVLNANGSYTYTPYASTQSLAQGQVVQDTFTYTVSDGSLSDTGTLTVNVTGVNDAPVANPDVASTGENSTVTVSVLANDTDVDNGAVLTVVSASAPSGQGSASVVGNQVQFNPGADFDYLDTGETAVVVVSYTIQDQFGAMSSSTVTITVNGANDAPVANDDTASTTEDASVSGNVLANDTDVDVEPLTVANPGTYVGANGTLILNSDGSYTYTPNAGTQALDDGESVADVFSYTASDGTASDTATLTITVNGANDAPVANDDTNSTNEDSAVSGNVLTNDSDVDVEPLTVASPGTYVGTYGTLVIAADGSYTYTPGAAAQGLDTGETAQDVFTYTASDGTASDTATLTVTVSGLNDAPVANDDTNSTDENSAVSGNVLTNDTDVDVETLTVGNPGTFIGAYGTLVLAANGSYTYTPGPAAQALNTGQSANDVFIYIASDGTASDTATLTITVNGLSGAPNAVDDTASTNEDSAVSGNVLTNDTDPENDTLTVSDPGTYTGTYGTLVLNANGSYTYTPNAAADALAVGESGLDVFSYTATDGTQSDTANLTITINGTNDAPTIDAGGTDASGSVTELPDGDPGEGTTVHADDGTVAFDDVDISDIHSASFTPQGIGYLGSFTLDPVNQSGDSVGWDFNVSDAALEGLAEGEIRIQTYEVEVDDGNGGTATQMVTITITGAGVGAGPQTVWFIDNTAVGSTNVGTAANPYTSIAAFNAAQGTLGGPDMGHTVHLLAGTGTGIYAEADGINLLDGQILVGDATGPVRPTIEATAGDGINVAQNNIVSGIDIGDTSGADIADSGGTVDTLTVTDVGSSGTGRIIDVDQGGTLNVTLNSAESTASTGGAVDLNLVNGSFTVTGATTIVGVHTGGGVDVTSSTNLAVGFQGGLTASTGSATAVNFSGNMGSSLLDISGLNLTTTTGTALNVTSGGTVEVTGTGNVIATTGGTAVNIAFATIGANGVTLESVSSLGGNATGIILNTAGSGGFDVTGSASIAGSGGTIANKTGADGVAPGQGVGIYVNATSNVSLANMAITGNSNGGIVGANVVDFTLTDSTLTNNGSSTSEGAVYISGMTGTSGLLGNVIGGSSGDNVHVEQTGGSLDLTIADSASDQAIMGTVNGASGNDSVFVGTSGSASLILDVDGVDFQGADGDLLHVLAEGSSSQVVTIANNNFLNTQAGSGGGVTLSGGGSGTNINVDFFVENNVFTGAVGTALTALYGHQAGMVRGNIEGNIIGVNDGIAGPEGSLFGSAIFAGLEKAAGAGAGDAGYQLNIVNNNINDVEGFAGIFLRANGGDAINSSILEATVTGNVVDEFGEYAFAALVAQIGDFAQMGLELSDNVLDLSGAFSGGGNAAYLQQDSVESHFYFPGYAGSPDGEFLSGTASADLDLFWTGKGNVFTNGGGAFFPGGVDAGGILGADGAGFTF